MNKCLPVSTIIVITGILLTGISRCEAQFGKNTVWRTDGNAYFRIRNFSIIEVTLPDNKETVIVPRNKLLIADKMVNLEGMSVSGDHQKFLLFMNTRKVWSYHTRGDYWVYNRQDSSFVQLGKKLPSSSLMFAKFSPDGTQVAYASGNNLYNEILNNHQIQQLTSDGNAKMFNGTFDWVYEQEFDCRDGFRWSPDSKRIAFWQIDATGIRDYAMLNTTDSVYSRVINVTSPIAGNPPSSCRIGIIDLASSKTKWMKVQTDSGLKSYIPGWNGFPIVSKSSFSI